MKRHILRNTLSTGTLAASLALFAMTGTAYAQETPQAEDASAGIGDIVVTARKREESLLKTPVAISAITSEAIEKKGIVSMNDAVLNTPGLNVSNASSGRNDRSFQQISLRGMTPSTANSTLTATFIDGVPVASATALNAVSDPARLEILRGPQSAYFGRNTFAGAINVVTKVPGNEWGGNFAGFIVNRGGYDMTGAIQGPLVEDVLSFRLSGQAFQRGGSYDNVAAPGQALGDQSTRNVSLLLAFTPASNLKIKAFGMLSRDNDGPPAQAMVSAYEVRSNNGVAQLPAFTPAAAGNVIIPSASNCTLQGLTAGRSATEARVARPWLCGAIPAYNPAFAPAQNTQITPKLGQILADGRFRVANPNKSTDGYGLVREYKHAHLNIDWDIGDTGITLSSLTGYNDEYYSQLADLDNYDTSQLRNPANPTGANPTLLNYWDFPFGVERRTRDFSQEVRANYESDTLRLMLGSSYLWTRADSDLLNVQTELVVGGARNPVTLSPPQQSRNFSVFGALNYNVTDALKINLEGRWQRDTISAFSGGAGLTISPTNQFGLPAGTYAPTTEFFKKSFSNFLPRVIVNYDVTPDMMVYASWSKAVNVSLASFNTGFLNGSTAVVAAAESIGLGVQVNPEKLTNYEVGLKGKFLDGKLFLSLAGYIATWTDQQNTRSIFIQDLPVAQGGTGAPQIVSGLANSGKTKLYGIELDMTLRPVEGVTLDIATSMNDTEIQTFTDPNVSLLTGLFGDDFKGNQLPLASKYSFNAGLQFDGQIGSAEENTWFIRGDFAYKSRQFVDASNIAWIKGRGVVNGRIGVKFGNYGLEVFALNLLNNKAYTTAAANRILTPTGTASTTAFGYVYAGLPELRLVGLRGTVKF